MASHGNAPDAPQLRETFPVSETPGHASDVAVSGTTTLTNSVADVDGYQDLEPDPLSGSAGQVDHRVLATLELLDRRWTWQILYCIHTLQPLGYAGLRRALPGPSHSVLVARLQVLTATGHLTRTAHPGPPMRTTYTIGPLGTRLEPVLEQMADLRHLPNGLGEELVTP